MERVIGLFHIARKAGKLLMGKTVVLDKLKSERGILVITSRDIGSDLERKLKGTESITIDLSSDQLGEIFNRNKLSVLAISDSGLAANIKNLLINEPRGNSEPAKRSL